MQSGNNARVRTPTKWSRPGVPEDAVPSMTKAGGSPLPVTYAGSSQVEPIRAGATSFINTTLGVTAAIEGWR